MNKIQEAQYIINNFKVPEKLDDNVVLAFEKEGKDKIYTFVGIGHLDEDINLANLLDRNQQGRISDEASKLISDYHEKDIRYSLHPLQRSCDLVHSKTKEAEKFYEFIMYPGLIHNLERFKELKRNKALLFADSLTSIENDQFIYNGTPVEIKINRGNVIDTLIKAGKFKRPKKKMIEWSIRFDNNGESSIRSIWLRNEGCFFADAVRPSVRYPNGLAVFGKTDEKVEIEKIEITKGEYEALLRDSEELRKRQKGHSVKHK